MKNNHINVFLETGCVKQPPKVFSSKWKVCQNNLVENEEKNSQYIHNGKGTGIIKHQETKT